MALMDSLKQALKGRSGTIERGVDTALQHLERYNESLKRRGESVKERARALDADRAGTAEGASTMPPTTDVVPPAPTSSGTGAAAAPPRAEAPSLRGDLVQPERPEDGPDSEVGFPS